jgi:hypothetical protein
MLRRFADEAIEPTVPKNRSVVRRIVMTLQENLSSRRCDAQDGVHTEISFLRQIG